MKLKLTGLLKARLKEYESRDFSIRTDEFPYQRMALYITFFALLARLVVAAFYLNSYDTEWNIMWAVQLGDGFFSAHTHVDQLDYPPLYLYPLYLVGRLVNIQSIGSYPPFRMLAIKCLPCLSDSLLCYVLWHMSSRKNRPLGLAAAALWAMNPAAIFNCACWGQTDCVLMLLAALVMLALDGGHLTAAGALWAVMCSTKLQGVYLTPVVGMEALTVCFGSLRPGEFSIRRITRPQAARFLKFVCAAAGTLAAVYLPFMLGAGFSENAPQLTFWEKFCKPVTVYSEGVAKYPYCTLNADNLYMLAGLNGVEDSRTLLPGLTVARLGTLFLLLAVALVVAAYLFGRRKSHWLAGFLFMECVFMLTCRQHERYQMLALVLLMGVLLRLKDRRLLPFYLLQSMVIFFNQFRVLNQVREKSGWWSYYKYGGGSAEWTLHSGEYAKVNALFNLLLFTAALLYCVSFFTRPERGEPSESKRGA